ncbi:hypothetical protein Z517_09327 [Fonsecaea pedrosoi CBS 271.37]|uniref:Unplaced genomic scaffold supercont1.6, whole genome shotgun sequence n=1 Tax=Fonsecaea pedrosoi CBS 271.37 TaxID=1442368 RepID=A0A0D2G869_9EURO|nr:uncharacterized protein Z517_09327 [Fonsecaea pedrosoi CBS 271.37]KIW76883.1 hypothetical protein Z517_09327 [Fonsecaea pedrosoi CBS 271.37]
MHKPYWQYGSTDLSRSTRSLATHANLMFVSLVDNVIMHYVTDPLLGFLLATTHVPTPPPLPLFLSRAGSSPQEHADEAAVQSPSYHSARHIVH